MPGKLYVAVLDEICKAYVARRKKRMREPERATLTEPKALTTASARTEESRWAAAAKRSEGQEERAQRTTNTDKAVKDDNAAVPVFLWNEAVCRGVTGVEAGDPGVSEALDVLRNKLVLVYWKKKVTLDLAEYLHNERSNMSGGEYEKCQRAGIKALEYSGKAGW
jgi:hypothetical protein